MFGPLDNEKNQSLQDLNAREIGLLIPLMIFMIWIGVRPIDFMKYSEKQIDALLEQSQAKSTMVLSSTNIEQMPDWTVRFYDLKAELTKNTPQE
jgi:NADH-quinone oxidoreductase subunit M